MEETKNFYPGQVFISEYPPKPHSLGLMFLIMKVFIK